MKTYKYRIGKDIYPDLEEDIKKELEEKLGKLGIKISFLFEDGVEFEYSDYDVKDCPRDVSFYQGTARILTYLESFDKLIFFDQEDNELISIPIYDPNEL